MRYGIRFHRYGFEVDDPKILHALQELYAAYVEARRKRKLANPIEYTITPETYVSLTEFVVMVIQAGIDVTEYRLSRGKPK